MRSYIEMGKITNAHGIKGELRVLLWCDEVELVACDELYIGEDKASFKMEWARPHKQFMLVKLEGIEDMNGALALKNRIIYADRSYLPDLPEGSYYIGDLTGMEVVLIDGAFFGTVKDVLKTGANDVLVIAAADGRELLAPFIDECVPEVDTLNRRILLTPLKGLFDDA